MEIKDEKLWKIAKKRAAFKRHLFTYLAVNAFLWIMWFFQFLKHDHAAGFPWPLFPTIGWGLGVLFNYKEAYSDKDSLAEKEYEKLVNKRNL